MGVLRLIRKTAIRLQALVTLDRKGTWLRAGLRSTDMILRECALRKAAALGSTDGMVALGEHLMGTGLVQAGREQALGWFQRAAEAGHPVGAFAYAELVRWEWPGGRQGAKLAFRWYMRSAEAGFGPAMAWLAKAYGAGDGVEANPAFAERWQQRLNASPDQGGPCVEWPPVVVEEALDADLRESRLGKAWRAFEDWVGSYATRPWYPFVLAVVVMLALHGIFWIIGLPGCGLILGVGVVGIFALLVLSGPYRKRSSLDRLEALAAAGQAEAAHGLGLLYRDGRHDVPRDRELARRHFLTAAQAGHVQAMVDLADVLRWQRGAESPDLDEARQWVERARAAGHPGLPPGCESGVLPVTRAYSPEFTRVEEALAKVRGRYQEEYGKRATNLLLLSAAAALLVFLTLFTYRNTGWLGSRDKNRVVWGDAMQRVAAPRDPNATVAIPPDKRIAFPTAGFRRIQLPTYHTGDWETTDVLLGRPVLLVAMKGRFPAFQETTLELGALAREMAGRATVLLVYCPDGEVEGQVQGMLQMISDARQIGMAEARDHAFRDALGSLDYGPMNAVLDAQGRIRQKWQGYQPGLLRQALESALQEASQ